MTYNFDIDGFFNYSAVENQRAALALLIALNRSIDVQINKTWLQKEAVAIIQWFFMENLKCIIDQLGKSFAFDHCAPVDETDPSSMLNSKDWIYNTPPGRSCSPDNIIRSWMPPTQGEMDPNNIHGVYGYNIKANFNLEGLACVPKLIWALSEGPGTIMGLVTYKGNLFISRSNCFLPIYLY